MGNPLTALAIAVLFAYWSLGLRRGLHMAELLKRRTNLSPLASILIIGAGGAFNGMLIDSGIGKVLADSLAQLNSRTPSCWPGWWPARWASPGGFRHRGHDQRRRHGVAPC